MNRRTFLADSFMLVAAPRPGGAPDAGRVPSRRSLDEPPLAVERLTMSAGAVAPSRSSAAIETEGGASSGDLTNILLTSLPDGSLLLIRPAVVGHTVVVKNGQGGSGQILTVDGTHVALASPQASMLLARSGSSWVEVFRQVGGKDADIYAVKDFGAKGDGRTDDTAAIQAAIDAATSGTRSGAVLFSADRTYRVTSAITYTGTIGTALTLYSDVRPGRTPHGARLHYDGAVGGTVIAFKGANNCLIKHLGIDASGKAKYGLDFQYDAIRSVPSAGCLVDSCVVGGIIGAESAAIHVGGTAYQVSEIRVVGCDLTGHGTPGTSGYGFIAEGASNVKNFVIDRCSISGFRYGVFNGTAPAGGASGYLVVRDCSFAAQTAADVAMTTGNQLVMQGCGSEGSPMLWTSIGGGGGANPFPVTITGCYWEGVTAADDVAIFLSTAAMLTISGCFLVNRRTGTALPRIRMNPGAGSLQALVSLGNYYANARGFIPVYDGSRAWSFDFTNASYDGAPLAIYSFGDSGGAPGAVGMLQPVVGTVPYVAHLNMVSGKSGTAGFTYGDAAEPRRAVFKLTIDKDAWIAAAPVQAHAVYAIPAKARVVGVVLDTTAVFAGLGGTITARVGKTRGGQEYLVEHDVKSSPVTRGLLDADLGTALDRAHAVQGGDLPSWSAVTSLFVTLGSGRGNLGTGHVTNLTSGRMVLYVTVEMLP